jgi:DNA-directed RNA polymerase alpha subunit
MKKKTLISSTDLQVRSKNALAKMNVNTLGELLALKEDDLLFAKGIGSKSLSDINCFIEKTRKEDWAMKEESRTKVKNLRNKIKALSSEMKKLSSEKKKLLRVSK